MALDVGRVCVKTKGRDAGSIVAVVDCEKGQPNYAVIEGARARRKKCNTRHLLFTSKKIIINKNASRDEVIKKLEESR